MKEIWDLWAERLRVSGIDRPWFELELIGQKYLGIDRNSFWLRRNDFLISATDKHDIDQAVVRRVAGEPLAYILGQKEFFGRTFIVDSSVLIPRPDTECVVDYILQKTSARHSSSWQILDLGCGSGCIGLTLLVELPQATAVLVDVSPAAISIAEKNACALKLQQRVSFVVGRAEELVFERQFDTIVGNPPYLDRSDDEIESSVKNFEPHEALFADEEGYGCIRRWLESVKNNLKPATSLVFEIGYAQAERAADIAQKIFKERPVYVEKDLAGRDRLLCVGARKPDC